MLGSRSQHKLSEKHILEFNSLDPLVLVDYMYIKLLVPLGFQDHRANC